MLWAVISAGYILLKYFFPLPFLTGTLIYLRISVLSMLLLCLLLLSDDHQEMDAWYKTKFQDLNTASARHVESVRGIREEVVGYKKDVSTFLYSIQYFTLI